ncbi:ribulose-phosphate 3-epimerase [Carnobacterium maltaromaticum]|uniref:ribulose-phosphate 3-epimerase n=1 Tax=Carnobacterium maltaromaticum TaxID=2751 RepID=UPI000C781B7F|nr:ribulose-phosphate 3-epimerase [Carnobacterium maltaromaticum]PLS38110.1 ribulose-phosphate 3-epimerase [Carnobacterium maltaromaticum]PLS38487.1 ribulose-phosphate 3-epimerase [Carnobacterium maltaromaticum]PLS38864.1 ribulose-phosphate 3-epimerase [Carnobacterium maltaromaticum]PLS45134.1 ribulose-phosphate 3-epimerase [Carnobacterium maltaromaticum]PLS47990.1 ribulose-phosphate 3-epimerase [Carnobacterium maltaromaticum]
MKKLLCPSMMCADFSNLKKNVEELDQAGSDIFHMDFMDGSFVPNFGMGLQDFELVRSVTDKPVDVHLMIQEPYRYVEKFADLGADIIYIHPEADQQPARTLDAIHQKGKKAGIAINPGTSVEMIQGLLALVDYVMVMTVHPGFSGQQYLEYTYPKIEKFVALSKNSDYKVMVDGAISPKKVIKLSEVGVAGFVLGTSALFGKPETYSETLAKLRK